MAEVARNRYVVKWVRRSNLYKGGLIAVLRLLGVCHDFLYGEN